VLSYLAAAKRVDVRAVRGALALLGLGPHAHDGKAQRARERGPPLVAQVAAVGLCGVAVPLQQLVRAVRALQHAVVRSLGVRHGPVHLRDVRRVALAWREKTRGRSINTLRTMRDRTGIYGQAWLVPVPLHESRSVYD
jgi:hypothetical protein